MDRLKTVIRWQFIASIANIFVAGFLASRMVPWVLPDIDTILTVLVAMPIAYILYQWANNISLALINMVVYRGRFDLAVDDARTALGEAGVIQDDDTVSQVVNIKVIAHSMTPIAKFMDGDIFEWIDVVGNDGVTHRMLFEGTMDMRFGLDSIPDGCVMLPPGILYKLKTAL